MQFTANEICLLIHGTLEGKPDSIVSGLAKIEDAQKGTLTFLANPKYESYLYTTQASVVIVNNNLVLNKPVNATLIRVADAYSAFSILLNRYNTLKLNKTGIEDPCFIHPTATIGNQVYIGAFAYIGAYAVIGNSSKIYPHTYIGDGVSVGDNCTLFSGVKVYHDCVIGHRVMVHASTVIGSDGFGFAPQKDGSYTKISQIGNVIIEDDVEIGANTCIDRATMGATVIKKGVKLDNLIQVAHNVEIANNTVIASQTGISGSSKIGENCLIGGQVGVVGHISVAKGSQIQAQSGVNRSIDDEGKKWGGNFVTPFQNYLKSNAIVNRLPDLDKKIFELEKKIKLLISQSNL
ncbi:MAG: UDP-3-O-(3-hydroxymyristoyl)glucosamine N-acyltransferase [Sphingobacteriales bacterium]|nr:MAG: UDP-3-O-(3-hydroxymyristoyl)glucosamine N-acyltransferase [Sphingobacteriales bacterium]TAF79464.1 MAG: UDP-3-O-(3-hydroxymyristoyl)glucosamine N-acyltransferase [Sphingobacteriales bacterium]